MYTNSLQAIRGCCKGRRWSCYVLLQSDQQQLWIPELVDSQLPAQERVGLPGLWFVYKAISKDAMANVVYLVTSDWWAQLTGVASAFAGLGEHLPLNPTIPPNRT